MAWVQNIQPPRKQIMEFDVSNFSGGLNNRLHTIGDNEASDLLNMKFLYNDVLEKRNGFKPFDTLTLDEAIVHLDLYKPYADEDQFIRSTPTKVYAGTKHIADVTGEIDGVNYQGHYFFADGAKLQVYGKFTSVTSTYVEIKGNRPDEYITLTVTNPPEGYTPLEKIHFQGKTVYDYDAKTVHYEPCEHELDDVYLGANLLPENPRFIEVHKGRVFISGDHKDDDNVYMTDVSNPFYFAVSLPIQLPPNSDKVRGMTVWDDSLLIGREYDIYRIIGETANPELGFSLFELRKINTHTGLANNKTTSVAHGYLFFLGSDGIAYALGTTQMDNRLPATTILSSSLDLFKKPIGATTENILDSSACFDGEQWYLTVGDITLVYNYRHRAWTMYDYVDMYSPLYYYDRIIWGRRNGKVVEFSEDYLDDGRPIYCTWVSKAFDMGSASRYKQFREFYVVAHAYDDIDTEIRVAFEIDYADVLNRTTVENKLSIWGKTKFGARFIDRNIKASIPFMIGRRARIMKIRLSNGYRVNDSVDTFVGLYDIPRKYDYMGAYVEDVGKYYYYYRGEWTELSDEEINQPMLVYQVNGEYEMKGKR